MAQNPKVGVDTTEAEGKFVRLQLQIRSTQAALQAAADAGDKVKFNQLKGQLDELNDSLEMTQLKSLQLDDALAAQPGVLGAAGNAMKSFDGTLKAFLANPVVAILAGIAAAFMALREALTRTEEGQAKLTKITEGFTKILNGLFAIIEPIAMALADLVIGLMENDKFMKGLTKTVGVISGVFGGLFAVVKNLVDLVGNQLVNVFKTFVTVASGAGKVLKGVFTLDWEAIKEGVSQVTDGIKTGFETTAKNVKEFAVNTVTDVVEGYNSASEAAEKSFTEGRKRLTDKEKKDLEEKKKRDAEAAKKAEEEAAKAKKLAQDQINVNEQLQQSNDELAESIRKKSDDAIQVLIDEQAFKDQEYAREEKRIKDLMALEKEGTNEYKSLLAQRNDLESKFNADRNARSQKIVETQKKTDDDLLKLAEETSKALAVTDEEKYRKSLADVEKYYNDLIEKNKNNAAVVEQLERAKGEKTFQINQEYAQKNAEIALQELEAKAAITQAYLDLAGQAGQVLQEIAGENKGIAIAGIIVEQAAAIGGIIQNTALANAKSVAAFPITAGMPWVAINTASAALSIASSIAAGAKAIGQIRSTNTGSGSQSNTQVNASTPAGSKFAKGGLLVGPSHSEGGIKSPYGELEGGEFVINKRSTQSFMPLLNAINQSGNRKYANGGTIPSISDLQEMMTNQPQPIVKTYVVASEMTSAQEANKKISDLARL